MSTIWNVNQVIEIWLHAGRAEDCSSGDQGFESRHQRKIKVLEVCCRVYLYLKYGCNVVKQLTAHLDIKGLNQENRGKLKYLKSMLQSIYTCLSEKTRQLSQMILGADDTKIFGCNKCFGVLNFYPSLIFESSTIFSTFTTKSDLCG